MKLEAVKIKNNFYWVGGINWDVRNFHKYSTIRGTIYNTYLLIDDKNTLLIQEKYDKSRKK